MGSQFRLKVEIFSANMKATHLRQKASFWEMLDNKGKLDLNHISIMCVRIILLHDTCIRHCQEYYIYRYTCIYHIHMYVYKLYTNTKSIERERIEGMIIHETKFASRGLKT